MNEFSRPFICTTSVLRMHSHEPYPYYKRTTSVLRMCVIFSYEFMPVRLYHVVFGKWFLIVFRAKFKVIGQAMRNNGK